ncbi:DNA (cytosine-5)-methyltransferase 3B-like [Uloborus diversus]|uniref:DNA (cytosine-5)-methyltransferase 3B-like n=1 Tax=Uloborus diversus TaxID=327109 RepID=UPI0024091F1A|nr:DNA (cytosine-5)-methyltransferase 3B-like [Uloborus diversus]
MNRALKFLPGLSEDLTLQKIKDKVLNIEDVCICCLKANEVKFQHPLFRGGMCVPCKKKFEEIIFAYGTDGKNIIQASPWFCFHCSSSQYADSLLEIRNEWETNVLSFYQTNVLDKSSFSEYSKQFPLKVLSLFDGISTGKLILDLLGIKVDKYYACEIDEDAVHVSKCQHIDSIIHLGDVCHLTEKEIKNLCPIDLVIGGSPCNDLSLVNPFRKGLYDFTGTGILFFEFFRILNTVRRCNEGNHVFFLFENVAPLIQEDKAVITSFLMVEPVLIDAIYISPQRRLRNYWGNIPGMKGLESFWNELQDENSVNFNSLDESLLNESLLTNLGRRAMVDKINTVTTHGNSMIQEQSTLMPVEMNGECDVIWVTELERIFGFPLHYTDTGNLSITTRRELLGRSWSVPVIKNILRPLRHFFQCKKSFYM